MIVPRLLPTSPPSSLVHRESSEFMFLYDVVLVDKPVLILTIRSPGDLLNPSTRSAADLQIRTRMMDLSGESWLLLYLASFKY